MKHHLSLSVVLLLSPVLQSSGLHCSQEKYPLYDEKCCRKCAPGTEMKSRCTTYTDTVCEPCEEGWYNPSLTTWDCKICTTCDPANGLREVKKCDRTSNTVCVCLPGYQPSSSEPSEIRCDPCPEGHFSKGGDEACTPWTNCTAMGRNTFRLGTTEGDTVCDNPPTVPRATKLPTRHSSKRETADATSVTKPSTSSTSTNLSTEVILVAGGKKSGYLVYILIVVALLLVSGGIILMKIFRKTKKYKGPGRFVEQMQKDGKNSFRIPIQEEQIDAKSSLVQN